MKKRVLQSMVDYVLEKQHIIKTAQNVDVNFNQLLLLRRDCQDEIFNYAKFISMPLTLSMFVPTDEKEDILKEPKYWKLFIKEESHAINRDCLNYKKSLDNVIFEGCTIEKKGNWFIIKIGEMPIWVSWNNSKKIESLLEYSEIILTQSAITKYQI